MTSRLAAAACLAGALLVAPWAHAYRTGGDTSGLSGTERVRWGSPRITYDMYEVPPAGLSFDNVRNAVGLAARTWMEVACASIDLGFTAVRTSPATPDDGHNTIQWLSTGWAERGFDADAAGITDVLYELDENSQWAILEADVYLNAESLAWSLSVSDAGARDVQTVLTHELGHVLGLLHPCEPGGADGAPDCASDASFAGATMYPFYDVAQGVLGDDDLAGACFLYPPVACETLGCPSGQVCTPDGCADVCNDSVCASHQICVNDVCEEPPCLVCACTSDADCDSGLGCKDGVCEPGSGALGDPCAQDAECESQACSTSGSCAVRCETDATCGAGTCSEPASAAGTRSCEGAMGAFGDACASPSECLGGECLQVDGGSPVCTRSCGAGFPACPAGWACKTVDRKLVCVPQFSAGSDNGCNVMPRVSGDRRGTHESANGLLAGLWIVFACAAARLRPRRRSTR